MKKVAAVLAFFLLGLVSVSGQTTTVPNIPPTATWSVAWTQDTSLGPSYRLWIDDVIAKNYKASEVTCTPTTAPLSTCTAPGVAFTASQVGPHTVRVSAYNSVGESKSDPLPVTVGWTSAPSTPSGLSIVIGS